MEQPVFESQSVGEEYFRWSTLVGPADPYIGRTTIGLHEVLHAHFLLVDYFFRIGEGIGGVGPKDIGLLHSALGRQFTQFGGRQKWNDRIEVCATLLFGLVKNHPFHDANKRTAFLTSILHLQKIGRTPTATHTEFEDFVVHIADNNLSAYEWYQDIQLPTPDKEIQTIAKFLKRNTRDIDLKSRTITYNELQTILNRRGLGLENPKNNRIDLVRYVDSDGETTLDKPKRIARIGFHAWTRQVSQKDISIARSASRLDARHGYDSQAFFRGLDDPLTLISKYEEPLRRLAFR